MEVLLLSFPYIIIYAFIICINKFTGFCITTGGPNPGKPCIFPFTFKGVTYNGCAPEVKSETWCSTKVDKNGKHVTGQSEYGVCSNSCPNQTGRS